MKIYKFLWTYGRLIKMKTKLEEVLNKVFKKEITPEQGLKILKDYPYQDLCFAKIDHHRELRRGFPEIVYGQGKTEEQLTKSQEKYSKKAAIF